MTKRQWKRAIFHGLVYELDAHLDGAAEWLFKDAEGNDISEADQKRMRAAVEEIQDEFERRAKGQLAPSLR